MLDDEMTEEHLASTAEDYYRVTQHEKHDEKLACAQAYIRALEGQIAVLNNRRYADTMALMVHT